MGDVVALVDTVGNTGLTITCSAEVPIESRPLLEYSSNENT